MVEWLLLLVMQWSVSYTHLEVYNGDLKIIPIDSISLERDFCICYHKNKKVTKKLSAFIETCQIYGQELKNGYIQNQDSIPNK